MAEVMTKQGKIEGKDMGDYCLYEGIPYAVPPVGELRLRPPVPLTGMSERGVISCKMSVEEPMGQVIAATEREKKWEDPINGRMENGIDIGKAERKSPCQTSAIAWQEKLPEGSFYEKEFYHGERRLEHRNEDCLTLNIWTPVKKEKNSAHAEEEAGKLPVLFWIHGGAFRQGFGMEREFDGAEYCKRGVILVTIQYRLGPFAFLPHPWLEEGEENLAIQDQLLALTWVYENIRDFSGDPERITVAGQSAGGVSVQALLAMPGAQRMIHQVILQSGGGDGQLKSRSVSREAFLEYGRELMEKWGIPDRDALLKLQPDTLLKLAKESQMPTKLIMAKSTQPVGKELLSEEALYQQLKPGLRCLLGSNRRDIRVTEEMLAENIPSDLYIGNRAFAEMLKGKAECYLYYFVHDLPGEEGGAFHSAELWYMFGTLNRSTRPFVDADRALSHSMLDAWSSFVKTGSPTEDGSWKPYRGKPEEIFIWG